MMWSHSNKELDWSTKVATMIESTRSSFVTFASQ